MVECGGLACLSAGATDGDSRHMLFRNGRPCIPTAGPKMLSCWAGIAILTVLPLGAMVTDESAPTGGIAPSVVVPAEVTGLGMFVSVMINGQGPFRMEVDTGCSISMISPEVAAAVEARGIDADDEDAQAVNGLGDVVAMPRVRLDSITIGEVEFKGVVAGVVPLELQSKIDTRALDGLLGYSLFSDLFLAMDFPRQNLLLGEAWPADLPPVRAELAVAEESGVPFVGAKIQGQDLELMIDTGANGRISLSPEVAASLNWKIEPRPGLLLAAVGESERERIGRLAGELELGQVRQDEPVADVSDGAPTLGVGLLRSFCLVFHESEDKLWLCSDDTGSVPSPPVRSVGLSLFSDVAGWRVAGIIPGSPAESAAIRPGDLVTEIEGRPAREWTRDQIQDWIDMHGSLVLRLASESGGRHVSLRVWLLVP